MIVVVDTDYRRSDLLQDSIICKGYMCVVINHIHPNNVCLLARASVIILDLASLSPLIHEMEILCGNRDQRSVIVFDDPGAQLSIDTSLGLSGVASKVWMVDREQLATLIDLLDDVAGVADRGFIGHYQSREAGH